MKTQLQTAPNTDQCGKSGFALLTLLFTAAAIAVQLAITLPRAAMEAQRIREEKLIYRGEQYKRAIQLYYRKHQKYPQRLDDLEDTNGVRFLRRRYEDPLTGENEWRLVLMGHDGRFKDSIIYDVEGENRTTVAGSVSFVPADIVMSNRRSDLDDGTVQDSSVDRVGLTRQHYRQQSRFAPLDGRFRGADRARAVRQSATSSHLSGRRSFYGSDRSQRGIESTAANRNGLDEQFGETTPTSMTGSNRGFANLLPSQIPSGMGQSRSLSLPNGLAEDVDSLDLRYQEVARRNDNFGSVHTSTDLRRRSERRRTGEARRERQQRSEVFGGRDASLQASTAIGQILTQPRPGGLDGLKVTQQRGNDTTFVFTGGIAGLASKSEEYGVKRYKGRETYNEWEFVFDYRKTAGPRGRRSSMLGSRQVLPSGSTNSLSVGRDSLRARVPGQLTSK